MANAKPSKRDQELIDLVRERLDMTVRVRARMETQVLMANAVMDGSYWASTSKDPQRKKDPLRSTQVDEIGPLVRQLHGRLRVSEFGGLFQTAMNELVGLESADLNTKIRLAQSAYWRISALNNMVDWFDDISFRTVVNGYGVGGWVPHRDPDRVKKTGGVTFVRYPTASLALDTRNLADDLAEHEWCILSEIVTLSQVNRDFEEALKRRGLYPLRGETPYGELSGNDEYLNRIARLPAYAEDSTTPALVKHILWDEQWSTVAVILRVPSYQPTKDGRSYGDPKPEQWVVVEDGDWLLGCHLLKLDFYKRSNLAFGQSGPLTLLPMQNVLRFALQTNLSNALMQSMVKILATAGAIESADQAKLKDNEQYSIIEVQRGHSLHDAILPIQMPRFDAAADALGARALASMYRGMSVEPIVRGETQPRQPVGSVQISLENALVPLNAISDRHRARAERWLANMAVGLMQYHGVGSPRRVATRVFGESFAGVMAQGPKRMRQIIDAGPIKIRTRDAAWRVMTQRDWEAKLDQWIANGHVNLENPEWLLQYFLATGQEVKKGQGDRWDNAMEIVRSFLAGQPEDIGPYDPHEYIRWICEQFLGVAKLRGYTIPQKQSLERAVLRCEELAFLAASAKASRAMLLAGAAAPPPVPSPEEAAGGTPIPAMGAGDAPIPAMAG